MQCSEKFFCEFYYDTYDAFYRYVKRITGRESMAEDVVQESYCIAYVCRDMLMKPAICAGGKRIRLWRWKQCRKQRRPCV